MKWFAALALVASLFAGCETPAPKPDGDAVYRGATFELDLQPSIKTAVDQEEGYAVHYFRVGSSKCQMGIYEGQKPKLFSSKERDLTVMRRSKVARAEVPQGDDVWGVDSNAKLWRESVWNCVRTVRNDQGKTYHLPTLLHIWYFGATEEEQQIFDEMVASLRMRP
ncbi:MAG: hypothetical protein IT578_08980 [Verrucomicrobiae bacterium]|nr:hypothetical protein [Verrucomicrobiae bacterium]